MEIISTYIGEKLADKLISTFRETVIQRWTHRRANNFFLSLVQALQREQRRDTTSEELSQLLAKISEDDATSETLFQAYRHVAFSRSHTLGPRVIGLLTAEIVLAGSAATDEEENIFLAAEGMSDAELIEAADDICDRMKDNTDKMEIVTIEMRDHSTTTNWPSSKDEIQDRSELNLHEEFGRWAALLENYGLVSQQITYRQWDFKEDSERHIDQDGTASETKWLVHISVAAQRLARLIERCRESKA